MWTGDRIILLADVSAPAAQAGKKGQVKTVDKDTTRFDAKLLVKGGLARKIESEADIETILIELGLKEKGNGTDDPADSQSD